METLEEASRLVGIETRDFVKFKEVRAVMKEGFYKIAEKGTNIPKTSLRNYSDLTILKTIIRAGCVTEQIIDHIS